MAVYRWLNPQNAQIDAYNTFAWREWWLQSSVTSNPDDFFIKHKGYDDLWITVHNLDDTKNLTFKVRGLFTSYTEGRTFSDDQIMEVPGAGTPPDDKDYAFAHDSLDNSSNTELSNVSLTKETSGVYHIREPFDWIKIEVQGAATSSQVYRIGVKER